MNKFKSK